MAGVEPTITSYALLGQLALRPWSVYEMTKNVARTLHWFWPRAESAIYAEMKRLADLGFARSRKEPGRRGRDQTIYAITPAGRRALKAWLATEPAAFSLHFEAMLRVHLSPYGSKEDLLEALTAARDEAGSLIRTALVVGAEFAEGRHQFQSQVHVRAILFDFLWTFGVSMYLWAERWTDEVGSWRDIEGSERARKEGVALIARSLTEVPRSFVAGD